MSESRGEDIEMRMKSSIQVTFHYRFIDRNAQRVSRDDPSRIDNYWKNEMKAVVMLTSLDGSDSLQLDLVTTVGDKVVDEQQFRMPTFTKNIEEKIEKWSQEEFDFKLRDTLELEQDPYDVLFSPVCMECVFDHLLLHMHNGDDMTWLPSRKLNIVNFPYEFRLIFAGSEKTLTLPSCGIAMSGYDLKSHIMTVSKSSP